MHGKTNLTRLLRENKPLRFFEVPESRMKEFAREANVRGLLYVPVRDRSKAAGKIEFAVWAEDAAKVNRVLEKMGVDYLQADTGAKSRGGPNACGGAAGCGTDGGRGNAGRQDRL